MYDLIIIGGGAAGLAAAVYAQSKQLSFVILYEQLGGKSGYQQQISGQQQEEYLIGANTVREFERQITSQAGAVLRDSVQNVHHTANQFVVTTQHHGTLYGRTLLIATGASPIALNVPGAAEFTSQGLGYSVTTHAQLLRNRRAAVVGSTPRALIGAIELARTAQHVYVVVPSERGIRTPLGNTLAHYSNIEVLTNALVEQIRGNESVEILDIFVDGTYRSLDVDAVFVDLGLLPRTSVIRGMAEVDLSGFIVVNEHNATTQPGLFAAGDCTTRFGEHTLIAIGAGTRAAQSAYVYLLSNSPFESEAPVD